MFIYEPLTEQVAKSTSRKQRIQHLCDYFQKFLFETPEGKPPSDFESDVMEELNKLKKKYRQEGER